MRFIRPLYIYIFEAYTQRAITYIDLVRYADLRSCSKKQSSPISQTLKLHCVGSGSTILRSILYVNFLLPGTELK